MDPWIQPVKYNKLSEFLCKYDKHNMSKHKKINLSSKTLQEACVLKPMGAVCESEV
jgi:hypothetical protein